MTCSFSTDAMFVSAAILLISTKVMKSKIRRTQSEKAATLECTVNKMVRRNSPRKKLNQFASGIKEAELARNHWHGITAWERRRFITSARASGGLISRTRGKLLKRSMGIIHRLSRREKTIYREKRSPLQMTVFLCPEKSSLLKNRMCAALAMVCRSAIERAVVVIENEMLAFVAHNVGDAR